MWLDQRDQALPRHHLFHFDQEQFLRVCLRLPAYSASAKVICFMGKLGRVKAADFAKSGSLFQSFLNYKEARRIINGVEKRLDRRVRKKI
jgi:hypothetical protein